MKQKIIAGIILFAMLTAISACGKDPKKTSVDANTEPISEETIAGVTDPEEDKPDVAESDYEGREFKIIYPNWSLYNDYYFAEESNGEVVNDAVYQRTAKVEEILNIAITGFIPGYVDTIYPAIKKVAMAGDSSYDLGLLHCASSLPNYVSDSIVANWNNIPGVDMEKSYWNKSVKTNMEIAGVMPFASNDFILPDVNSIFFNSSMLADNKLDDPYALVENGTWTWDKLIAMSSVVSADINGDGKFDKEDQYGFVAEKGWQFASFATGCNEYCIKIDNEGKPYIALDEEIMTGLVEKLANLLYVGNCAFTWDYKTEYDPNVGGIPPVSFDSGHALFYHVPLSLAGKFRSSEVDFGIIPDPKYSEAQEDYITLNWAGFMCVPMSASDFELVGKTVELLGYYNKQIVVPAFYNILLGQKISRNESSSRMLDIIFKNTVYDLGINLSGELYSILPNVLKDSNSNYTSYMAKKMSTLQKMVDDYYEAHVDFGKASSENS